jgi:hypothetical protein
MMWDLIDHAQRSPLVGILATIALWGLTMHLCEVVGEWKARRDKRRQTP